MGFHRIEPGGEFDASFDSLHIFEVRGFNLPSEDVVRAGAIIGHRPYELAIGMSVNALSQLLFSDDYTEDEDAWAKEHKATSPYVLIHFGATAVYSSGLGYLKKASNSWTTYETFTEAKAELLRIEDELLPPIQTALAVSFNCDAGTVRFQKVHRTVFGLTPSGITVHDIRISGSASGYVSSHKSIEDVQFAVNTATQLAAGLTAKVSLFARLGLEESDPLKRFLYFFLVLEVETNRAFQELDLEATLSSVIALSSPQREAAMELLKQSAAEWSLAGRFTWCVITQWTHVTIGDVVIFKRLKRTRVSRTE